MPNVLQLKPVHPAAPTPEVLFTQHKAVTAWFSAYFSNLANHIKEHKQASGCFDDMDQCKHEDIHLCWQSIVYSLALAIHGGPDFISNYSFNKGGAKKNDHYEDPIQLCPFSRLNLPEHEVPGSSSSKASGRHASHAFDESASWAATAPGLSDHGMSNSSPFRTQLLEAITSLARSQVKLKAPDNATKDKSSPGAHDTQSERSQKGHDSVPTTRDVPPDPERQASRAAHKYIKASLKKLEDLLPPLLVDSYFFFLAIDKVVQFNQLLPIFHCLWRESKPRSTWLFLIDTDSNIAHLAGKEVIKALLRLGDSDGRIMIPPFTYLPFNVIFQDKAEHLLAELDHGRLTFHKLIDTL